MASKTDPTGLIQSLAEQASSKSLLRPAVLGQLVRRFIAEVLDAIEKVRIGDITRDLGASTVEASCRFYAGILIGSVKSDDFEGGGDWLSRGLPKYLRDHHGLKGDGAVVVSDVFAVVAKRVFSIVTADSDHEAAIDALIASALAMFGGMGGDAPATA